ncbi:hypothetical protein BST81_22175 [Leptolyngbya sp. 'hensonii']|uniref:hypothetical protein n=1 Tax=Leptolyngbya sp. 'hensonii' TaxID=1922337 RepID=UPI00094FD7DF|nr:hypothetical protein [Leptolyngbya sp. 'hensonii']OLP16305.1 hypothetical protein BST81_22175 [Leptolyngbya sp. 'hensonii']
MIRLPSPKRIHHFTSILLGSVLITGFSPITIAQTPAACNLQNSAGNLIELPGTCPPKKAPPPPTLPQSRKAQCTQLRQVVETAGGSFKPGSPTVEDPDGSKIMAHAEQTARALEGMTFEDAKIREYQSRLITFMGGLSRVMRVQMEAKRLKNKDAELAAFLELLGLMQQAEPWMTEMSTYCEIKQKS